MKNLASSTGEDGTFRRSIPQWLLHGIKRIQWHQAVLVFLLLVTPVLAFRNLDVNPRPWQDEGGYLTLAKTLAEKGVYGVQTSEGYQTYGAVQSLGPTVIVPIAAVFRTFGTGLLQARIINAIFSILATFLFYWMGKELLGARAATLGLVLLLGTPATDYLMVSREVLGENVSLGFFCAGVIALSWGLHRRKNAPFIFAGLLLGAAIVTRATFAIMIFAALALFWLLDIFYYRSGNSRRLILLGLSALLCVAAWWAWQYFYFGAELFQQNLQKLGHLAQSASKSSLSNTLASLQFLLGTGSGHFYYFFGFPALIYMGILCLRDERREYPLAFVLLFCLVWIGYDLMWIRPWQIGVFAPMAVSALFVGKLWLDLIQGLIHSTKKPETGFLNRLGSERDFSTFAWMGSLLACITLGAFALYNLQSSVRSYVLDRNGESREVVKTPLQFDAPRQLAAYLNENVASGEVIETWERELGILTDLNFHYPDQSMLADTAFHCDEKSGASSYTVLGEEYFQKIKPEYLVIGWVSRSAAVYDFSYLSCHAEWVAAFGTDDWRYDVYRLRATEDACEQ